jgi:hypothetical protein
MNNDFALPQQTRAWLTDGVLKPSYESPATTHMYVEADLAMKERALNTLQPPHGKILRYRPHDRLMQLLESL